MAFPLIAGFGPAPYVSGMIQPSTVQSLDVSSHYDDLDEFYREVWGPHVHHGLWLSGKEDHEEATRNLVDYMAGFVALHGGSHVMDIGCGYGETARYLREKTGCRVTGLTISERQLAYAAAHPVPGVEVRLEDWLQNSLPASSADFAFSIESSEHMPALNDFFREGARVLKPGANLAVYAWLEHEAATPRERRWLLGPLCREGRMRLNTRAEYEAAAAEHELVPVYYEDLSDRVSRTWTLCLLRLAAKLATDRRYQEFVFTGKSENREFAKTLLRIRAAYATGAMRYGLFFFQKPAV